MAAGQGNTLKSASGRKSARLMQLSRRQGDMLWHFSGNEEVFQAETTSFGGGSGGSP
jgi:hypothetical protein